MKGNCLHCHQGLYFCVTVHVKNQFLVKNIENLNFNNRVDITSGFVLNVHGTIWWEKSLVLFLLRKIDTDRICWNNDMFMMKLLKNQRTNFPIYYSYPSHQQFITTSYIDITQPFFYWHDYVDTTIPMYLELLFLVNIYEVTHYIYRYLYFLLLKRCNYFLIFLLLLL